MKYIAQINVEFVKEAAKWDDMSLEDQKGYLSRHPKSKRRLTGKPGRKRKDSDLKGKSKSKKDKFKRDKKTVKKFKLDETKTEDKVINLIHRFSSLSVLEKALGDVKKWLNKNKSDLSELVEKDFGLDYGDFVDNHHGDVKKLMREYTEDRPELFHEM